MTANQVQLSDKKFFPALTGIRAIAAYMVFLHHSRPFAADGPFNILYRFTEELHVGVTLFFVLSGFLIAYRYLDADRIDFRQYFVNRFARIYPVYFLLTAVTFIVFAFVLRAQTTGHYLADFLLNITFLKGFFDQFKFTGIAQAWSLTVEELFYFSAPFAFILIKKSKSYLYIIPACLMGAGILLVLIFRNTDTYGFFGSFRFMFSYTYFGRVTEFFAGISLAVLFHQYGAVWKTRYCTISGLLLILLSVFAIGYFQEEGSPGIYHPAGILINNFILPLAGVSLLFWGLITEATMVRNMLQSKFMVLLGKSSYAFYLVHWGVFFALAHKLSSNLFVIFILLNLVSLFIFKFLEEPMNLYFKKRLSRKVLSV